MSMVELVAPGARARIDPRRGGRVWGLEVDGMELLSQSPVGAGEPTGFSGGSFPMVPFAGFIPEGRLRGMGATMSANVPGGASHGLVYDSPWKVDSLMDSAVALSCRIDAGWLSEGEVRQRFELSEGALRMSLSFDPVESVPAALGFHPWFRRDLGGGPAEVLVDAAGVRGFDDAGMAAGLLEQSPPRPWDHFVVGVRSAPVIRWPELELTLEAGTTNWIVYERPIDALCLEPVTAGPADVVAGSARAVPEESLSLELTLRWSRPRGCSRMETP